MPTAAHELQISRDCLVLEDANWSNRWQKQECEWWRQNNGDQNLSFADITVDELRG